MTYKKALQNLAHVAFIETSDDAEGNALLRQILYRYLYKKGIIDYKNGIFIYKGE